MEYWFTLYTKLYEDFSRFSCDVSDGVKAPSDSTTDTNKENTSGNEDIVLESTKDVHKRGVECNILGNEQVSPTF